MADTGNHLVIFDDARFEVYRTGDLVPDDETAVLTLPLNDVEMTLIHLLRQQSTTNTSVALGSLIMKGFNRGVSRGRSREMGSSAFGHPLPGFQEG